jgi:hypothetical protein
MACGCNFSFDYEINKDCIAERSALHPAVYSRL